MCRVKVVAPVFFAVVVLNAVGIASASANWMAGGRDVPAGTNLEISLTTTVHEALVVNFPGLGIKISCTGLDIEKGFIIGGTNNDKAESLLFLGCSIIEPKLASCEMVNQPNGEIRTGAVLSKATLFGPLGALILFSPETTNTFSTLQFKETNTCALAGEQPIKGRVTVAALRGRDELLLQEIEGIGSFENNSLEIGAGNKAYIEKGKILLRLVNDSKWSVL